MQGKDPAGVVSKTAQIIWQVDAFANEAFKGNPAGVCVLNGPAPEGWMQNVAMELNLPETAFVWPEGLGSDMRIRWFNPQSEVELCGHATLAAAHVLFEQGGFGPESEICFLSLSGELAARRLAGGWLELDFPATPPEEGPPPEGLAEAVGMEPVWAGMSRFDCLLLADSAARVRSLQPDFTALLDVDARGVIVTAPSGEPGLDFISRYFSPTLGINEDPVTGRAHCCLAPFWAERLGRRRMVGYQASPRGGTVRLRLGRSRVYMAGQAVTVLKSEMLAPAGEVRPDEAYQA